MPLPQFGITSLGDINQLNPIADNTTNITNVSNDELTFVNIAHKAKMVTKIQYKGNSYLRSKVTKGSTYWLCDRAKMRNCRARITVFNDSGHFAVTNDKHTHLPSFRH